MEDMSITLLPWRDARLLGNRHVVTQGVVCSICQTQPLKCCSGQKPVCTLSLQLARVEVSVLWVSVLRTIYTNVIRVNLS